MTNRHGLDSHFCAINAAQPVAGALYLSAPVLYRTGTGTGQVPTALSRVFLLVVSFVRVSFPVSSVVSAVRRLSPRPLGAHTESGLSQLRND
jgi:hypothetical protein